MKTLILGAGKMMEAILVGLKDSVDMSEFQIFSPSGVSAKKLSRLVGAKHLEALENAVSPKYVWLGCKPQQLKDLKKSLGDLFPSATYLSLLAALPEIDQINILDRKKLVRAMPNLPVRFKAGVTLLSSVSAVEELDYFKALFSHLGLAKVLTEEELEELTLLTGSGPAFFYEFAKNLSESFSSLDQPEREALVRQVLFGSGMMTHKDPQDLSTLIGSVTSKGGVTIAVLEEWRKNQMMSFLETGVKAGKARSGEIKALLRQS